MGKRDKIGLEIFWLYLVYRMKKPSSKKQTLKTSFKAPMVQQMPYKERPRRIIKNKKIDDTFA
jgi:hypothetical protein